MIQSSSTETVDACLAAAARGVAWLLDQQTAAGSWRQLEAEVFDAYYKGGWALAVSGQPAAAHRLLTHVQRAFLTAEGDFEPRAALLHTDIARLYASSYVVLAAQKLDRYEIAAPAVRYLLSQQDPDHGGFYSGKTPAGGKRRSDSMSTAMSGVALLAAGQTERAALAGDCLLRMVDMQPAAERFFTTLDETGRLEVDFPPEAAVWRVVEAGQTGQRWFAVGLPFAFAVLLHAGDRRAAVRSNWPTRSLRSSRADWSRGTCPPAGRRVGLAACSTAAPGRPAIATSPCASRGRSWPTRRRPAGSRLARSRRLGPGNRRPSRPSFMM